MTGCLALLVKTFFCVSCHRCLVLAPKGETWSALIFFFEIQLHFNAQ